jgi:hypothetical protein
MDAAQDPITGAVMIHGNETSAVAVVPYSWLDVDPVLDFPQLLCTLRRRPAPTPSTQANTRGAQAVSRAA